MGKTYKKKDQCYNKFDKYKFGYIIRYKETDAPTIKRNFNEIKIIDSNYEYQNEIIFGDLKDNKFYALNVIIYDEEQINKETGEIIIKNFSYVASVKVTNKNKEDLVISGKRR